MTLNIPCRSIPMPYYTYVPPIPDYSAMPLTYECISGTNNINFSLWNGETLQNQSYWNNTNYSKVTSLYYRKIDPVTGTVGWIDWKAAGYTDVNLTAGQKLELSGMNSGYICPTWNNYVNRFTLSGDGKMIIYGNISSLFSSGVDTVRLQNLFLQTNNTGNGQSALIDASKCVIPYKTDYQEGFNLFSRHYLLTGGPLFTNTDYYSEMYSHQF